MILNKKMGRLNSENFSQLSFTVCEKIIHFFPETFNAIFFTLRCILVSTS